MKKSYLNQLSFIAEVQNFEAIPKKFDSPSSIELAFLGRSNVGKSSLINALAGQKVAKTSSMPGKTRGLIFFQTHRLTLVDLPGYGYAKVSKTEHEKFSSLTETYLQNRKKLKFAFLLLDVRHLPSKDDCDMKSWLDHMQLPYKILLTKTDKLTPSALKEALNMISMHLGVEKQTLIPYNRSDLKSIQKIAKYIEAWI